jgi:hypothetical protein
VIDSTKTRHRDTEFFTAGSRRHQTAHDADTNASPPAGDAGRSALAMSDGKHNAGRDG